MAETKVKKYGIADFWVIVLTFALSLFGIIMVFSASYYAALSKFGDPYHFLIEDLKWMALGWAAFIFFALVDYHLVVRVGGIPLIFIGFVLLGLIFTPMGIELNNAVRWLDFKFFTVMPGEIIKFCLLIFLTWFYAGDPERGRHILPHFLTIGVAGAAAFLIYKQPNLSTAGIVGLMAVGMAFVAGIPWKFFLPVLAAGAGVVVVAIQRMPYMMTRVQTAFDPFKDPLGDGYQVVQGLLALGSGGVLGKGLGQSIQKTLYLPEPQNDFILAIIGEELGYVGVLALIIVFVILIWRCSLVAIRAADYMGMMLASGVTILLALQVILNIAVVSASFFPTGVFLPFISQGGNATIIFLAMMGILVNVSRQSGVQKEEP